MPRRAPHPCLLVALVAGCACDPPTAPPRPSRAPAPASTVPASPPPVEFLGLRTTGRRVAYLIDGSGSMMTAMDVLRAGIARSVNQLGPDQSFTIIFYREGAFTALETSVIPATAINRREARDFLDRTTVGNSSDPLPGTRAAFASGADTIFLLTNGDFPNNDAVLDEFRRLNHDHRVTVHTIGFQDPDPEYQKFLRRLAAEHGGAYHFAAGSLSPTP